MACHWTLISMITHLHRIMTSSKMKECTTNHVYIANSMAYTVWASCQIRKLRVAHAPGMSGTFSLPQRVSDPDMHHGTYVTRVPCCMPGSLTRGFLWSRWRGNVRGIPGACATRNFTYLARGPWMDYELKVSSKMLTLYMPMYIYVILTYTSLCLEIF